MLVTEERLRRVERFFAKHGGLTILIGRYVGFVRPLAPFVAGFSHGPKRFFAYDVVGTGLWAATFTVLGYVSWRNFDRAVKIASNATLALGVVVVLGLRGRRRAFSSQ